MMADMSPLETRLREALDVGTAGDRPGADLANGARTRAAARRRQRLIGVGAAAALATGMGLTIVVDNDRAPGGVPPATNEDQTSREGRRAPSGWHLVRWRGVTVQVPNTWGSGALSEWCRRGPLLGTPVVERPGAPRDERCSDPAMGYGAQFLGADRSRRVESHDVRRPRPAEAGLYPRDAWIGVTCGGCDVAIRVVAPDPYVARYLLGSYDP